MHQSMKNWKQIKIPRIYISAFQHHLIPVALIPKVPLHMFVLKSLFIGGSMCCNIQISRKWTVKAKSITSKTQPVMAPALHICPFSNLKCSLFQMVPYDCPDFNQPVLHLYWCRVQRILFSYLQVSKKNDHFCTGLLLGCPSSGRKPGCSSINNASWTLLQPFTSLEFCFLPRGQDRFPSNTHKV